MTQASAPGKVILFGEHAVVYDRPAIAVPVPSLRAIVEVDSLPPENGSGILVKSPALDTSFLLDEVGQDDPLSQAIHLTFARLEVTYPHNMRITIHSDIPMSAGLGSGAAVTVAIVRALCRHFSRELSKEEISAISYEVERLHHSTPSGVDNTVISYEQPVYFRREQPVERFKISTPFTIVIAHSGESTPTGMVVDDVRASWEANQAEFEKTFDAIGRIVDLAYAALRRGDLELLGPLMDQNQTHLEKLGVSSATLDKLIHEAREAGAAGAKLSGGGRGGVIIALVDDQSTEDVIEALIAARAPHVFQSRIA